jgi:hypothetical protein
LDQPQWCKPIFDSGIEDKVMAEKSGLVPGHYIQRFPSNLRVRNLEPKHEEGFIGFEDVVVDKNRVCWIKLDALVRGANEQTIAFIIIQRTAGGEYRVHLDLMPSHLSFEPEEPPDPTAWVRAKVVE